MPVSTEKPLVGPACPHPDTTPERIPESHNPSAEPLPKGSSKLFLATLQPCSPTHLSRPRDKAPARIQVLRWLVQPSRCPHFAREPHAAAPVSKP